MGTLVLPHWTFGGTCQPLNICYVNLFFLQQCHLVTMLFAGMPDSLLPPVSRRAYAALVNHRNAGISTVIDKVAYKGSVVRPFPTLTVPGYIFVHFFVYGSFY